MGYKLRRRLYSQNFLRNPKLTAKLIRLSSIGKKDLILEIGPGKGVITEKLLETGCKVIAIELDRKLCLHLNLRFGKNRKLELVNKNFLNYQLPRKLFKVFSNIPFSITADIIRKLTSNDNFLEGYLIVQKEAAKRFVGTPYDSKNSMQSMLLRPFFNLEVVYEFGRWDFVPQPNVDIVLLKIIRRENPLIESQRIRLYRDFIIYSFTHKKFSYLSHDTIIRKFNHFSKNSNKRQKEMIIKKAHQIISKQKKIQKINRTRNDKWWKNFNK